jgi:uncharacterized protein YkwD/ribosomal protein L24E
MNSSEALIKDEQRIVPSFLKNKALGYLLTATLTISLFFANSFAFGADAKLANDGAAIRTNAPIISMASTPTGAGYWLVATDGGIFAFGDAGFHGSTGGQRLNQPIVGMAATPSGQGYWLVAKDGGIFTFGDAQFYGSTGGKRLNQPIVGMAPTPSGRGYWLVATDGGIFSFGDAQFYGSTGSIRLNQPIVGMASVTNGQGYWLVASDGGIFAFGSAGFYGSTGSMKLNQPVTGMTASRSNGGYRLVARDGGIFSFGDAQFYGSTGGGCLGSATVAMTTNYGYEGYYSVTENGQVRAFSPSSTVSCQGIVSSGSNGSSSAEANIAADIFARANAERGARGLRALTWDNGLAQSARNWSVSMSANNNFAHSNIYPLLQRFQTAAENIGVGGRGTTSGALHVAWMRSTGHRVNLLAPNLDAIGIGAFCGPDGRLWVTQQFGRYVNSSLPSGFGSTPAQDPITRGDGGGPTC